MPITEDEFSRICADLARDRRSIIEHNPIGSDEEILLWMLLNSLSLYLSLNGVETPCFPGRPDAATYREAIMFILRQRRAEDFDITFHLNKLLDE